MKVRLKIAWGQWSKGHVFTDMPGGQARMLIARNIAEEASEDASAKVVLQSPADRMMRASKYNLKATTVAR